MVPNYSPHSSADPLRLRDCATKVTVDLIEKLSVINLLIAFPYAVKNYLRGNYSYEAEDLKDLIAHLPRVATSGLTTPKNSASNGKVNGAFNGDAAVIV